MCSTVLRIPDSAVAVVKLRGDKPRGAINIARNLHVGIPTASGDLFEVRTILLLLVARRFWLNNR